MPITNKEEWNAYCEANKDSYGRACIVVAENVMEALDANPDPLEYGYYPNSRTPHAIICKADKDANGGGLSGFMAGCVAQMVRECHSRGDDFWEKYSNVDKNLATLR